jgi:uncharacterized membrane protein
MKFLQQSFTTRLIGILMTAYSLFYLAYPFIEGQMTAKLPVNECLFKSITHLPCPGCGYVRSVQYASQNHWHEAFLWHPFFIAIMLVAVVFLVTGLKLTYSGTLFNLPKWFIYSLITLAIVSWATKFIMGSAYY